MMSKSLTADQEIDVPAASRAFEDLDSMVALYEVRIFRFLLASVRDRDLAQTMTQETFFRAWNARESFRGDCAPATWLTRIAVNLVRDHTRTGRFKFWKKASETAVEASEVSDHLPHHTSSAESALIARQQLESIWRTVAQLSDRQRTVFLLRFVEELDLPEIAEATGMPISTVKSHLYRALETVRRKAATQKPSERSTR
jgi:RNA polymerase sigma-70 factor (ECF subfamily)